MYVDIVPNRNSRPAILLREGWREGKRVRKRTIANISSWPRDQVERLRLVLKNVPLVHPDELFVIERSLPHGQSRPSSRSSAASSFRLSSIPDPLVSATWSWP